MMTDNLPLKSLSALHLAALISSFLYQSNVNLFFVYIRVYFIDFRAALIINI